MIIAPFVDAAVVLLIIFTVKYIRKHPQTFFAKYWAVLLCGFGLLVVLLSVLGVIENNHWYNEFVAQNHYEPDGAEGIVYIFFGFISFLIALISSPFAFIQIRRPKKRI